MEHTYKEGDKVFFDDGIYKGIGIIRGLAINALPILGEGYIMEVVDSKFWDYEYSHYVVYEHHLKPWVNCSVSGNLE